MARGAHPWPAAEYHIATLTIPAARRLSVWVIAITTPPTYLIGLTLLAWEVASGRPGLVPDGPAVGLRAWLQPRRSPRRSSSVVDRTSSEV
jgi:hypothetical protein